MKKILGNFFAKQIIPGMKLYYFGIPGIAYFCYHSNSGAKVRFIQGGFGKSTKLYFSQWFDWNFKPIENPPR